MTLKRFWKQLKISNSSLTSFKYYLRWKKFLDPARTTISDRLPWITFQAIDFLGLNLKPAFRVFEYGGGGSTLFFLDRVEQVVTVEHNEEWFSILQNILSDKERNKWTGKFIAPEPVAFSKQPSFTNPLDYFSSDADYPNMSFKNYATAIDNYAEEYFDIVLVDGRARPSCIYHAVKKIKTGGYLVLDNSDRDYYLAETSQYLAGFKLRVGDMGPLPYNEIFAKTSIWQKG